jgi:endo-1,4-beta-D-glucanase Y
MDWNTEPCGAAWEFNGASDAELDAAMALIQADARWGGYAADATNLITIIRDFETEVCSGRIVLKAGDAWGACDRVNPSYFAPAYYRAFAQFVPDQAQHWNDMVVDTYELYDIMQTRMSGLYPDWVNPDGSDNGGQYWWEACRVPWRVATDYAWSCSTDAADSLAALDGWVDSNGGIAAIDRPKNSCFSGGFALTGVSASQAELDSNVTVWLANSQEDTAYYQSTLRVLYMLVAAGQFASIL